MSRTKAIAISRHGGPEVLEWIDLDLSPPAAHEVQVRHTAIGQNFSDINLRSGGFYLGNGPRFPIVLGNEAAGVVETVGSDVDGFAAGDRVAYAGVGGMFFENTGAYAQARNVPATHLVKVPDWITDQQAAGMLLKGLTASGIVHRCFSPAAGDPVLIHAAASGVGSILAQWYKHLGALVIGTVGNPAKAGLARKRGCDHTILYRQEDFVPAVRRLVPEGVAAVLDGVGKDTFLPSFDCLRPFGTLVNYGNASGPVPPFNVMLLAQKGYFALYRPGFGWHASTPDTLRAACDELFELVRTGALHIEIAATFRLEQAAEAHRAAESAGLAGSIVLLP
ncbi:MAG TPA: quinone oxidoreductase [Burkholderiaceae bacterium]|nr:quinone oxidoreductase [Burkholderiaceae bacterium]